LMRSDDGGASWETTWLGPMGDIHAVASLDVRPGDEGHVIHVAYPELVDGDMSRPVYQISRDGGTTWSKPLVLDVATSYDADRRPAVRAVGDGAIVTWYQPLDESTYTEFTLKAAHIAANGTVQPLQVNQDRIEHSAVAGSYFLGSGFWMGLAPVPGGAYALWEGGEGTDTQVRGARLLWEAT
ncbi:MAG: hypothetical protein R3185_04690, partial [Candidatus Thermoplasmatota archaeon]|nr:hypothetical protein [Candidatus Thermoplasmatota archaeon]